MPHQRIADGVLYPDTSALERPSRFPRRYVALAGIIVAIAVVLGIAGFWYYNYTVIQAPARAKAAVEEALSQEVSYDFPTIHSYAGWSADEVLADLDASGVPYFQIASNDPTNSSTAIYHSPATLSLEEAQGLYEQGFGKLKDAQVAQLLCGGWELSVSSQAHSGIRLRFADFTSGSIDSAIANALSQQGLGDTEMGEAGTDSSGNTYQTGSFEIDDEKYIWRISALKLSDVYSADLSDDAIYVGIRVYQE